MQTGERVVLRPSKSSMPPYVLRAMCRESGKAPADIVAEALAAHPTFEGAAEQLGVTLPTLRAWRRRYALTVRSA